MSVLLCIPPAFGLPKCFGKYSKKKKQLHIRIASFDAVCTQLGNRVDYINILVLYRQGKRMCCSV